MDTGFLAAVLVAAVLLYDRLGGNQELSRRLFQIGLAVSLIFVVISGAEAFIRADTAQGGFVTGTDAPAAANRVIAINAVQYGFGAGFLIAGLTMMRRYHTVPMSLALSGVFLLLTGPAWTNSGVAPLLLGQFAQSTQKFEVGAFVTAVVGTIVLLGYGMQIERESAVESEADAREDKAESSSASP